MHIQRGRLYIGLAEHYMHLASMMRLVVKEVEHRYWRCFHVVFPLIICVRNGSSQKIGIRIFEECFNARVFFDSCCA